MNIADALNDLKIELCEGFRDDLVAEIAADYDLNPILLARKFRESFGVDVADYNVPKPAPKPSHAALLARCDELWTKGGFYGGQNVRGKTFTHRGRECMAYAYTSAGVHFIFTDTREPRVLKFKRARARDTWVLKNLF